MDSLTCKQLQKMMIFSCERVEREKEEINKINVFPVPDQDTGSNLAGTLNGVKDALENKEFKHIRELADAALDGALMAAQGNTGIIYTGFLVGFFNNTKEGSLLNADYFADAFEEGYKRARESIQDPKEGTILDVMESFAATFKKHRKEKNIVDIFEKALEKANEALLDTPNKMPLLKKADVVDAGGLGFLMILETYFDVLEENDKPFSQKTKRKAATATKQFVQILTNRYEVVALMHDVQFSEKEMHDKLKNLGDCLDIIQVKDKVKIHIHTDDPYDVRDIIRTFGEEEAMRIEDMAREIVGEDSVFKNKIGIVTDEISNLTEKNIKHYIIESIPYKIEWDGIDKLEGETVPQKLKKAKENKFNYTPQIHSIDPEFFKEAFKRQLKRFDEVICITSANEYFKTFDAAMEARKELPMHDQEKIFIVDSRSISAGQTMVILKAIDLIQEQLKAKTVVERLERKIKKIKLIGVTNSPFVKSLPVSRNIKKIIEKNRAAFIEINDTFNLIEGIRKEKCVDKIVARIKKDVRKDERILAVIIHGDNLEKAKELKTKLKTLNVLTSFINSSDPVISLNIGYKGLLIGYTKL